MLIDNLLDSVFTVCKSKLRIFEVANVTFIRKKS